MLILIIGLLFALHSNAMQHAGHRMILIGAAGKQAQEYYKLLKDQVVFTGFVQPNPRSDMIEFAKQEKIAIYNDLEAIPSESFDGALVTVPHYLHFAYTKALLNKNKFVIKEKPLAIHAEEANFYKERFLQGSPSVSTIVQRQFQWPFLQARSDLDKLGRVYSFKYEYSLKLPGETTGWRAKKSLSGGGALVDMGYHTIDILTTFFGLPEKVSAQYAYKYSKTDESTDDEAYLLLSYPNNIIGSVVISRYGSEKKEVFEIFGDKGSIKVTPQSYALITQEINKDEQKPFNKQDSLKDMFNIYLKHLADRTYNLQELERHAQNVCLIEKLYSINS